MLAGVYRTSTGELYNRIPTLFFKLRGRHSLALGQGEGITRSKPTKDSMQSQRLEFMGLENRLQLNRPNLLLVRIIHMARHGRPIVGLSWTRCQRFDSLIDIEGHSHGIRYVSDSVSDKDHTKSHYYLQGYLKALEERTSIKGYSVIRWGLVLIVGLISIVYIYRESLKENFSDEVADVATAAATRSMENEDVMEKSKEFLREIINDPITFQLFVNFMKKVLTNESVVEKARELSINVLNDPQTREAVNQLAVQVLMELLENETLRTLLHVYTKQSCILLLDALGADPQTKQIIADFFQGVLAADNLVQQAVTLGKNVSKEVVNDKKIQEEAGSAFWTAVKKVVVPEWFF